MKEKEAIMSSAQITRRDFLKASAGATAAIAAGVSVIPSRAFGANDRLRVGIVGAGGRGGGLLGELHGLGDSANVEIVAVCDTWHARRAQIVTLVEGWYDRAPKDYVDYRELLEDKDVDAVIIAPPDFAHAIVFRDAMRAGKDAYVEKPFATEIGEARDALDAAIESGRVVQVGTQRRSEPMWRGAAKAIQSGMLGKISRIEIGWNDVNPRWNKGNFDLKESDVDWRRYLMNKPYRPFDPHQYREWQLYRDFTNGPFALLGVHFYDVVHWYMNDPFPTTAVALGGNYVWEDHREHEDTVTAVLHYPSGFLCECTTMLGNATNSGMRAYGTNGMFSDATWTITPEGGGANKVSEAFKIQPEPGESHMGNWISCIRSGKPTNAPVETGYNHAVASILSYQALLKGRRLRYIPETRQIVNG